MSNVQLQLRADTATNLATATPAAAELGVDTTRTRLVVGNGSTAGGIAHAKLTDAQGYGFLANCSLAPSISSNNLTMTLNAANGSAPSAANSIFAPFRTAGPSTSSEVPTFAELTGAPAITISNGDTLGTANNVPFRLWWLLYYNGGTPVLGVINCRLGGATPTQIVGLDESALVSPTATIGNNAGVFYCASTVSASSPFRILGYTDFPSGLATAGTWNSLTGTKTQLFGPGIHKPGDVVQRVCAASSSGSSSTPSGYTPSTSVAPAPSNGVSLVAGSITPISAVNVLSVEAAPQFAINSGSAGNTAFLYVYNGTATLATSTMAVPASVGSTVTMLPLRVGWRGVAGGTSSITFTAYGTSDGSSLPLYVNETDYNGTVKNIAGGTSMSRLDIEEIMG